MLILEFILFVILGSTIIGILIILGILFAIAIMAYKAEKLWEEIRKNK